MAKKTIVAGDFKYQVIDGLLHCWPVDSKSNKKSPMIKGSESFGGPQRVKTQDIPNLPKEVQALLSN